MTNTTAANAGAQNQVNIDAGQKVVLTMSAGQNLVLTSGSDVQGMTLTGKGELTIKFSDGASLVIKNFHEAAAGGGTITLPNGQSVNLEQLALALDPQGPMGETQLAYNAPDAKDGAAGKGDVHLIKKPGKGEDIVVKLEAGDEYKFSFNMTEPTSVKNNHGQLVISFKNGGEIIIPNYGAMKDGAGLPDFTMSDGTKLGVSDFSEVLATAAQLNAVEPAAGDAGGGAGSRGGFGFGSVFSSGPLENLNAIGPIAPTALQYQAPDREYFDPLIDDQPQIVAPPALPVDETNLSPGPVTVSGQVLANFGHDGPGSFSATNAPGNFSSGGSQLGGNLTSEGSPVTVTLVGNTFTGTSHGATIFTLTINSDGTYTFNLTGTLDHADASDPDDVISLNFGVTATDADGDKAMTFIQINVHDDGPVAHDDVNSFDQVAGGPNVTSGNVITGVNGGPGAADDLSEDDGNSVSSISFGGTTVNVPAGGTVTISGTYGSLSISSTGEYTYTLYSTSKGDTTDDFTYVLKDGDGDTDPAVLRINSDGVPEIYDPNDPTVSPGDRVVDETNLGPTSVSGQLNANFYTDTPGTITPSGAGTFSAGGSLAAGALTSEGHPVTVTLAGNTYTGTANGATVFTLTINADGSYTFTLDGTLDHADVTDPDDVIQLNFGVTATDSDGDTDSATLTINVKDDGPVANDDANFIDQAATDTASGNVITGAGNDPAGGADVLSQDDDNNVISVTFGGTTVNIAPGATVTIAGTNGVLTIDSHGNYSYTLNPGVQGDTSDDFTYVLQDGDGDTDPAVLSITSDGKPVFYDPNDPTLSPGARAVDETNLSPTTSVSGDMNANFFTDTPGTITATGPGAFFAANGSLEAGALSSNGIPVTVTLSGNTYTGWAGSVEVFNITVDPATGNYTFNLLGTLDHADVNDPNDVINLHFGYTATDSDGDTATAALTIRVYDDGPTANDDVNNFDAEDLSTTGNVVTGFNGGPGAADVASHDVSNTVTTVAFGGTTYAVPATGTISVVGTYGTLTIAANGDYTYVLKPGVTGDTTDNFTYGYTDGDGDTDLAVLQLNADGIPVFYDPNDPRLSPGDRVVDETNLGPTSVSGDLNANFFTDTPGTITPTGAGTFTYGGSFAGAALTSEGQPVTVTLSGNTYTGTSHGETIFTLTVNPANGNYTFTLLGTLDHRDTTNPDDVISLNFGYTATDSDGDTATATLTINVKDDGPVAHDDFNSYNTADGGTNGNVITGFHGGPGAADHLSNDDVTPGTPSTDNYVTKVQFGSTVVDVPAGGQASIHGDHGTLTIHSDGSYTYVLDAGTSGGGSGGTTIDQPRTFAGNTFPTSLPESVPVTDPNLLGEIHSNMTVAADTTITGQITFDGAGYTNSLGLFTIAADGTLQQADMVQTSITGAGATFSVDPSSSATQLGFFLVADGFTTNGGYAGLDFATGELHFIFNYGGVGERAANINDAGSGVTLVFTDAGGVDHVIQGPIYFTTDRGGSNSLNPDGLVHTISGVDGADPQTLTIGFEDLPNGGDKDYNDVVFNIQITDHITLPGGGDVSDEFIYTLTDGDGDSSTAILHLDGDGIPVVADPAARTVDESDLGPVSVTGAIHADFFTDTPGTITPTAGSFSFGGSFAGAGLTSEGQPVTVTLVGNTFIGMAHGQMIFNLQVLSDGNYTFNLFGTLDHRDVTNPDDVIQLNFGITATDSDGDTDTTVLTVNVRDDGPIANDDTNAFDGTSTNGNVITGLNGGAGAADAQSEDDANTVTKVTFNGTTTNVAGAGNTTIVGDHGTLVINAQGQYTYTLKAGEKGDTTDQFIYTLKDGDGDTDTAVLTLKSDGVPELQDPNLGGGTRTVDESNLAPNTTVSGTLVANFYSDTPGTYGATSAGSFTSGGSKLGGNLTSEGHAVTVTLSGNTYTGTANGQTVFTLTINPATGGYTFDLKGTLDHANASDPDDVITLNFGVKATDSDGDVDTDILTINVKDDGPVANDDSQFLDNGVTTVTGNVVTGLNGGAGAADHLSQDDVNTVTKVAINGTTYNVAATGNTTITTANGTLTINAQGQYSYTLKAGVKGDTTDQFTYTLRDGDGDTDTALLTLRSDGAPDLSDPNLSPGARLVDETDLHPNTTVSGTLQANFYTDTPGTYGATTAGSFGYTGSVAGGTLTSEGHPVTVTLSGNTYTGTANGQTIFTLTINPTTGNYTFDLKGTLDHADKTNPDDIINLNFGVKATDSDGDTDTDTLTIRVKDDGPLAHNDVNNLSVTTTTQPVVKDYNIVMVLDVSGSMGGTKLDLLKGAVNNLLTSFNGYTGGAVKVHFVTFSTSTGAESTFTITNAADFAAAKTWINALVANGNTNYEDPLQSAVNWLTSTTGNKPIAGADTYTYFLSDGEPNTYVDGANHTAGNGSASAATVMNEIQGIGESDANDPDGTKNEVAALKALSTEVIGVGIGVSSTTLARLDIIDSDGHALDVHNPADLSAALQGSNPVVVTTVSVATGNVITGVNGGPGAADTLSQDDVNHVTAVNFGATTVNVPNGGFATIDGTYGTLKLFSDGSYTYTAFNSADTSHGIDEVFRYTLTDGDGDPSNATLTFHLDAPLLKVGKNVDDNSGSTTTYEVGGGPGVINGAGSQDILVGDVGGSSLQNVNKDYNVVLVLDVSGSMAGTKLDLLKGAVNNLMTSFNGYTGGQVKIHLVTFSDQTKAEATYTVTNASEFNAAKAWVTALVAGGTTNYEDPLQDAITWLQSTTGNKPIAGADTYTYFVSDGEPNRYMNNSNTAVDGSADVVMQNITGTYDPSGTANDDNISEVAILKSLSTEVIGVGIGVSSTTLARLDVIDSDGHALDVKNPADLSAALQGASPLNKLAAAGADVINGGDGGDFIFGDTLNTDALAAAKGLATLPGTGWGVFAQLEAGGTGWTRADTINYIKTHASELGSETVVNGTGRTGGNDTLSGGAGDDVIFGQEGNDLIDGGAGNDTLVGGSGGDTFAFHAGGGVDHIVDFNVAQGDKLDLSDILSAYDPLTGVLQNFVHTVSSGADTLVQVDPTGSGAAFVTVAVLEGVHLDLNALTATGNLIA